MTPQELTDRAHRYLGQALAHLDTLGAGVIVSPDLQGEWRSLRANLESAQADLATVLAQPAQP